MVMKRIMIIIAAIVSCCANAWTTLDEMEAAICAALADEATLLSASLTNQLTEVVKGAQTHDMKSEAYMLLSINAYQNFLETTDGKWLPIELQNASNAVVSAGMNSGRWQYWVSRFLYAGAYVSDSKFSQAFSVLNRALSEMSELNYTNGSSRVERAILEKCEMPGIGVAEALKVMAGMSAVELGQQDIALRFANQVSERYGNVIREFAK